MPKCSLRQSRARALGTVVLLMSLLLNFGCPHKPNTSPTDDAQTTSELVPGELVGWWVIELMDGESNLYGLGAAEATGSSGIQWDLQLADHRSAVLSGTGTGGPELTGELSIDAGSPTTIRVARLDPSEGTLAISVAGEPFGVLHPVSPFAQQDVGAFRRVADGATVIFAHNLGLGGTSGVMSVLDAGGYWPEDYRYKGYLWSEDEIVLTDTFMTAARFDEGARIYSCLYDWATDEDQCGVLDRLADEQLHTERGGVWLGKAKRYDDLPEWFYAVVVGYGDSLYIHERDESFLDSLFEPQLRAVWDETTGEYVDTDQETSVAEDWRATPSADGVWLFGEYDDGDPETREFHSLQRIVQPPDGYLTGNASSLSADWFDAPLGIPEPTLGSASIEQLEDQLTIVDHSDDGETYQIDAQWTGYQYEGSWHNVSTPSQTSPWRGQLIGDGWYLHGTWEHGEYSFSALPIVSSDNAMQGPSSGALAVDVYNPDLAYFVDAAGDTVVVVQRNQASFSRLRIVTSADGEAIVHLDERTRPVFAEIVDTGVTYTLTWRPDSTTADVVMNDPNTGTSTSTLDLDLSLSAIQARVSAMETDYGVDLSSLSGWFNSNPGRMENIYLGLEQPFSARIYDPALSPQYLSHKNWADDHWPAGGDTFMGGFSATVVTMIWAADAFLPMAFAGVGGAFAFGFAAGILVFNLVNYFVFGCSSCSLICFLGCL